MDSISISILALIVAALSALWSYLTWPFSYWSSRGIPGPKPIPILGNMHLNMFNHVHQLHRDLIAKYGKMVGFYFGRRPALILAEPERVREICIKNFHIFPNRQPNPTGDPVFKRNLVSLNGDEWKRVRSITTPTFTSGKLKSMYNLIEQVTDTLEKRLDEYVKTGGGHDGDYAPGEIRLKDAFGHFTMDVIARCAFAVNINMTGGSSNTNNGHLTNGDSKVDLKSEHPFVQKAREIFTPNPARFLMISFMPKWIVQKFQLSSAGGNRNIFFRNLATQIISQRKQQMSRPDPPVFNDYLQLLLEANKALEEGKTEQKNVIRVQDDSSFTTEEEHEVYRRSVASHKYSRKTLDDIEMAAQCIIFLMAGYETTASTLSFVTYCLATMPEVQEKLYNSIIESEYVKKDPETGKMTISYEDIGKLDYMDAVVHETLRVYSPVSAIARQPVVDYTLEGTNITIKKGQTVMLSVEGIHKSEDYWPKPYEYDPERFMSPNKENIKPYTWVPFGAGPRNCVAMRFALMEVKQCLFHVVTRYKFSVCPGKTDVPLDFVKGSILLAAKRLIVKIEKR